MQADGTSRSPTAISSSAASRGSPSTIERWWSSTTTSICRVDQVAETLGRPAGTVRSRLHYAMRGAARGARGRRTPTSREARRDEERAGDHAPRAFVAGAGRHCAPRPRAPPGARRSSPRRRSDVHRDGRRAELFVCATVAAAVVVVAAIFTSGILPTTRQRRRPPPNAPLEPRISSRLDEGPLDAGTYTVEGVFDVDLRLHRARWVEHVGASSEIRPRRDLEGSAG